jgi:hypothetical protein
MRAKAFAGDFAVKFLLNHQKISIFYERQVGDSSLALYGAFHETSGDVS